MNKPRGPLHAQSRAAAWLLPWLLALGTVHAAVGDSLSDFLGRDSWHDDILEVEEAFPVIAELQPAARRILLHWDIQPGYYLYRDKFSFAARALRLGEAGLPEGVPEEDPEFGMVQVLEGNQTITLPFITEDSGPVPAHLEITYQGCKRDTLCYPVARHGFELPLGDSGAGGGSAVWIPGTALAAPTAVVAEPSPVIPGGAIQDFFSTLRNGNAWLILSAFFAAGLLLAFTPCILPMLPILSGIIVGERASGRRALLISGNYVLGMALTYALFGLVAGLMHYNLQAALQLPWVLILFSAIFVALALSMFDVFSLQAPAALQTRLAALGSNRAGLVKASVMGVASALIVGPCVAPAIVGALLFISVAGEPLRGAMALFTLGLGMGAPLLAVGVLGGHILPRAGLWMVRIRQGFGVLMLGVALWLLGRVLPDDFMLLLWAALCIAVGIVYLGALEPAPTPRLLDRFPKALGAVLLIYGAALLVGATVGGGRPAQPLAGLRGSETGDAASSQADFRTISDYSELQAALDEAGRIGQPTLLKFHAEWCVTCKKLDDVTFPAPEVQAVLSGAMLLLADVTDYEAHRGLLRKLDLVGPPAVLFFGADGRERSVYRLQGFLNATDFSRRARQALWGDGESARGSAGQAATGDA